MSNRHDDPRGIPVHGDFSAGNDLDTGQPLPDSAGIIIGKEELIPRRSAAQQVERDATLCSGAQDQPAHVEISTEGEFARVAEANASKSTAMIWSCSSSVKVG